MNRTILIMLMLAVTVAHADTHGKEGCAGDEKYQTLEFWLGDWDVYAGRQKVGTNRIEQVLNSCVVIEHWKDVKGNEGKSFFYRDLVTGKWKQVWATDNGFMKEKELYQANKDGRIVFQGPVLTRDGRTVLDRTTLWREGETVRQLIEQSADGGKTWNTMFDAIYRKQKAGR